MFKRINVMHIDGVYVTHVLHTEKKNTDFKYIYLFKYIKYPTYNVNFD